MEYVATLAKEGRKTLIDFPDCPGCQTFADPGEDVEAVAREALQGWLEVHLERGDAPPRPRGKVGESKALPVRIAPALAIALQLRWRRQELGLSQAQLGTRLGVTRQQVALLEKPTANLRVTTLARAAEALEMELDVALAPVPRAKRASAAKAGR
jgi:DNA-binding XRE family transcriptional regulator/predicted RNase H-like HicB family nuclease